MEKVKVKEEVTSEFSLTEIQESTSDFKITTEFSIFEQQVKEDVTSKESLGLPIKSEIPDIKYGIGDDDIYIKLEPLISEELHIKNDDDGSTGEQAFKGFPQDELVNCIVCSYRSLDPNHMQQDSAENPCLLEKCGMKTNSDTKVFKCATCGFSCAFKNRLQQHIRSHTREKCFVCTICDYKCSQKYNLKLHIRTHTGEKPFTCGSCDYKFGQKGTLQRHILTHTGEKPFTCGTCDYKCREKSNLQRHTRTHTREKPFICGTCDHKFGRKSHLLRHILTHTREKAFTCGTCDYKCGRKSDLQRHILASAFVIL